MADHDQEHNERAAIRTRFAAARARIADVPEQQWAAERDDEVRTVREWAAARRRNAA